MRKLSNIMPFFVCAVLLVLFLYLGLLASVYRWQHASAHVISGIFFVIFPRRTSLYASLIFLENA